MTLLVIILGAGICYWLQNIIYEKYWSKGLFVDLSFQKKQVVKGETVELKEVITNNKVLPLLMLRLKFMMHSSMQFPDSEENVAVSDLCYKNDVFSLLFFQKITRTIPFVCTQRGFFTIDHIDLISSNLFLNISYIKSEPIYREIIVFPSMVDASKLEIPFQRIMGELLSRKYLYADPFEFRGIREYMPTDTMSSINWKSSAKSGELLVNVHEYTASQEICLLLNLEKETQWEADTVLEECISMAAGLCEKLLSVNVGIRILCNGCDLHTKQPVCLTTGASLEHMETILTSFARIDLKLPMQSFLDILEEQKQSSDTDTLYVMISEATGTRLQTAYEELAMKNSGAMWILPYDNHPEFDVKMCPSVQVLSWEVAGNAK